MKIVTRIKSLLYSLCALILAIAILIICTARIHSAALDARIRAAIWDNVLANTYIIDRNGQPIYSGDYSPDDATRLSTFHLVGTKAAGITNSLLYEVLSDPPDYSRWTGYEPRAQTIELTIDLDMQKGAYTLLTNKGYNGCVIVSDYITGEILTLVSTPCVDTVTGNTPEKSFINKATTAYVPGSVFKVIAAAAILEANRSAVTFTYNCTSKTHHITCFLNTAHGQQTLAQALSNSCNCAISTAAKTYLTPAMLNQYAENSGVLGNDIIADLKIENGNIDSDDDLMWSANGQSKDMLTPLGVVSFYNAIANNGTQKIMSIKKDTEAPEATRIMAESTSQFLISSLKNVTANYGFKYDCFGKTGTAQLGDSASHAWFACCLTGEDAPPYTVLVFIEHGGNSGLAKELARDFINNYI